MKKLPNVHPVADAVSVEYSPVPLALVPEYLLALEQVGVVEQLPVKG